MMDRDRAFIPAQQIGFMNSIAAPVFKYVSTICTFSYIVFLQSSCVLMCCIVFYCVVCVVLRS